VEDEAVGWEVYVVEGAQPVEGAEVDVVLEEEAPVVGPLRPDPDGDLGRLRDGRGEVGELEEAKVEVLSPETLVRV
jgi:hypothetical protein